MTKFRKALKNEKGFTLIELLVVVVIIGVLSAIAVPNLVGASDKAKEKKLRADLKVFETALDSYYSEETEYPDQLSVLVDTYYLKSIPKDPWNGGYTYNSSNPDQFTLNDSNNEISIYLTQEGIQEE